MRAEDPATSVPSKSPLAGILVLDFTTLLPGPYATLALREAGARVIKIERPGRGDEMRSYRPCLGEDAVNFALLNAGKESVMLDLRDQEARARFEPLLRAADVLVEQFRPGVMQRLGLGYEQVRELNPGIVYCSITGYGQFGPKTQVAAHDLNYIADTGMLSLGAGPDGRPVVPSALVADIGAGAYPALTNILLGLLQRQRTGEGMHLDIAMTDNLFSWMYWALGNGFVAGQWPKPGSGVVTGGSPRYNVYQAADGRFLAVGALEDKFWRRLCELLGLEGAEADDIADADAVRARVAARIAEHPSSYWQSLFAGEDVCCNVVRGVEEAVGDPHFVQRGLFSRYVWRGDQVVPALATPVDRVFLNEEKEALSYPALGQHNSVLEDWQNY